MAGMASWLRSWKLLSWRSAVVAVVVLYALVGFLVAPMIAKKLIVDLARDYTGREVARVGVFVHSSNDESIVTEHNHGAWELARLISMRLGHAPGTSIGATA